MAEVMFPQSRFVCSIQPLQLKIVCLFYESYNHCVHDG